MQRECEECGEDIPEARLKLVPETTMCVECLTESGDVQKYKGIRESNSESGQLSGCEDNIIRNQEKLKGLKFPTRRVCK